tara:strand:+ start:1003 stop:1281 length:279 start_codon:yes stop_codon:yes gene_type:complete
MLVRLIELKQSYLNQVPILQEVYLNPRHIISVVSDINTNRKIINENIDVGVPPGTVFSAITLQEGNSPRLITVVGSPTEVYQQIKQKQILKG